MLRCGVNGNNKRRWFVYSDDPLLQHWYLTDKKGTIVRYASFEVCQKVAEKQNEIQWALDQAKHKAEILRNMTPPQRNHLRSYGGIRAAYWGCDPCGLFTSDIDWREFAPFNAAYGYR